MNPGPEWFDEGDEAAILIIFMLIALCLLL